MIVTQLETHACDNHADYEKQNQENVHVVDFVVMVNSWMFKPFGLVNLSARGAGVAEPSVAVRRGVVKGSVVEEVRPPMEMVALGVGGVVCHWVVACSVWMGVRPWVGVGTEGVSGAHSFMVMNPSVQMNLWVMNMRPHMGGVSPGCCEFRSISGHDAKERSAALYTDCSADVNRVDTDVVEPFRVVHHSVIVNFVDVDDGCSFIVVNPSVQMNFWVVDMHPHMG